MEKEEVKDRIRAWIESNLDESIDSIKDLEFQCRPGDFIDALDEILIEYESSVISEAESITK